MYANRRKCKYSSVFHKIIWATYTWAVTSEIDIDPLFKKIIKQIELSKIRLKINKQNKNKIKWHKLI